MSKPCSKCEKPVYPIEEFKCLDKIWHKGCFKCSECGMTLNMKTYKGFNKLPYCEAHIPKAKATTVADTPEMKRMQENTKNQSNAMYHAEFEKAKGKFTPVTDDPELLRIKQNTKIISNVAYHGELEKKAMMEQKRTLTGEGGDHNSNGSAQPSTRSPSYMDELSSVPAPTSVPTHHHHQQQQRYGQPQPQQQQQQQVPKTSAYNRPTNNYHSGGGEEPQRMHHQQQQQHVVSSPQHQRVAQPQGNNPSPYSARGAPNVIYSSQEGGPVNANARNVGSIADFDPVNNYFGSLDAARGGGHGQASGRVGGHGGYPDGGRGGAMQQTRYAQPSGQQPVGRGQIPNSGGGGGGAGGGHGPPGVCYKAMYDYEAQDNDEVSFIDGDFIVDCTAVEAGWMTGTVQRTGRRGMLPANYVKSAN